MQTHMLAEWFSDAIAAESEITTTHQLPDNGSRRAQTRLARPQHAAGRRAFRYPGQCAVGRTSQRSTLRPASSITRPGPTGIGSALFARTARECDLPSTIGRDRTIRRHQELQRASTCISRGTRPGFSSSARTWPDARAPAIDCYAERALVERTLSGLAPYIPNLRRALEGAQFMVGGGWIVAPGGGSLADAASAAASA